MLLSLYLWSIRAFDNLVLYFILEINSRGKSNDTSTNLIT
jgi:hypothetical protein